MRFSSIFASCALTLLPMLPAAAQETGLTISPGAAWAPFPHTMAIERGSVFDFSFLADAPAGKYGMVKATPAGHFEFANRPGRRFRFWGVNLCFTANFLSKAQADELAEVIVRSGYNAVRFHHFDRFLTRPGGGPSHELDATPLDQIEYLFHALKERGVYISTDLFVNRVFTPAELESFGLDPKMGSAAQQPFKTLVPISEAAYQSWATFSKNLLTHRNPYTGMTWAEDPALIGICPVNEDSLPERVNANAGIRARYETLFRSWLEKPANKREGESDEHAFARFVAEVQIRSDDRMRDYLRSLGVKAPLTGANYRNHQGLAFVRERYDYVDNHQYFDHPVLAGKGWSLPFEFHQGDPVRRHASTPVSMMPTRIFGKPFVVTEFNFVRPNQYRAQGGVIMPAYASLQDWDGLFNFEYSSSRDNLVQGGTRGAFSLVNDPVGLLADRVSALLFLREDIAPAPGAIGFKVDPETAFTALNRSFPQGFSRMGLVTRIGSFTGAAPSTARLDAVVANPESAAGPLLKGDNDLGATLLEKRIIPAGSISVDGKRFKSETGEIELRADEGTLKVVSPRSELFVMATGSRVEGGAITVDKVYTPATVSVISIDGEPISTSSRLLVLHITEAIASGTRFSKKDRKVLESWGELPILARKGSATLSLRLAEGRTWKAYAVSPSGKRVGGIPLSRDGGTTAPWSVKLETIAEGGGRFAYELVAEK